MPRKLQSSRRTLKKFSEQSPWRMISSVLRERCTPSMRMPSPVNTQLIWLFAILQNFSSRNQNISASSTRSRWMCRFPFTRSITPCTLCTLFRFGMQLTRYSISSLSCCRNMPRLACSSQIFADKSRVYAFTKGDWGGAFIKIISLGFRSLSIFTEESKPVFCSSLSEHFHPPFSRGIFSWLSLNTIFMISILEIFRVCSSCASASWWIFFLSLASTRLWCRSPYSSTSQSSSLMTLRTKWGNSIMEMYCPTNNCFSLSNSFSSSNSSLRNVRSSSSSFGCSYSSGSISILLLTLSNLISSSLNNVSLFRLPIAVCYETFSRSCALRPTWNTCTLPLRVPLNTPSTAPRVEMFIRCAMLRSYTKFSRKFSLNFSSNFSITSLKSVEKYSDCDFTNQRQRDETWPTPIVSVRLSCSSRRIFRRTIITSMSVSFGQQVTSKRGSFQEEMGLGLLGSK